MVNFFNSSILMDVMLCTAGSLVVLVLTFATFIFSVFDKKKEMGIFKTVFLKQVFKIDLWIQAFVLLFLPLFLWGASDVFLILFLWENSDVFFQFFLFLLYLRGVWIFVDIIKDSVCWALDSCKVNTGKFKESKFKDFFISNYKCENYENFWINWFLESREEILDFLPENYFVEVLKYCKQKDKKSLYDLIKIYNNRVIHQINYFSKEMFDFIVDLYLELNQDKRNQEFEIEEIIQKEFKYSFIIDEKSKKSKSYQSLVKIKNVWENNKEDFNILIKDLFGSNFFSAILDSKSSSVVKCYGFIKDLEIRSCNLYDLQDASGESFFLKEWFNKFFEWSCYELEKMMTGQKDVYYSEFDNIIELFLPDVSIIWWANVLVYFNFIYVKNYEVGEIFKLNKTFGLMDVSMGGFFGIDEDLNKKYMKKMDERKKETINMAKYILKNRDKVGKDLEKFKEIKEKIEQAHELFYLKNDCDRYINILECVLEESDKNNKK